MAKAPEQIAPGVYRVDTIGISNAISVLVVADSDGWMLIDTGLRAGALRIQEALRSLGAGPRDLRRIYLTHHHDDHIGGLPAVRWWATEAEVVASEHEAQVISGERPPDPPSNALLRFFAGRAQLPTVPVDRVVHEGDSLAGFRVNKRPPWLAVHERRFRQHAVQSPGWRTQILLHRPCRSPTFSREAAEGGVLHRSIQPW
jgi:glyoxylase-like metal-dependent hydrolase (beta-lactamase superfamily II)